MQGVQHVVESRGIGVNVHLPSVALKAFVGGSHGHCWVELRYLLRHLQYTVSTCRWVKARSDWFESSWSKRHMLTRADLRDSDRHCRYVRRPLTMPTQEYLVSTRFVLTFLSWLVMEEVLDSPRRLQCWLRYSLRRSAKYRKGFA